MEWFSLLGGCIYITYSLSKVHISGYVSIIYMVLV